MGIELRRHLPAADRVEVFLRGSPDLTREEAEVRLTSLWVECPAKGAEVSMGEACCQGCPHLKRIDYQRQRIQCNYELVPVRRLELIIPKDANLKDLSEDDIPPLVVACCPLTERVTFVGDCTLCLYYRGEEEEQPHRTQLGDQVGWLLCSASLPEAPDDGKGIFVLEY